MLATWRVHLILLLAVVSSATARLDDFFKRDIQAQMIGNYMTIGCSHEQLLNLTTVLSEQWLALSAAMTDLDNLPGKSSHGFSLFFNNKANVAKVKEVVAALLSQAPRTFPHAGPGGLNPAPPTFVCFGEEENAPLKVEPGDYCSSGNVFAHYKIGSPAIFVCPVFWKLPMLPTPQDCPTQTSTPDVFNYGGPWGGFFGSQYNAIIHELIHFYQYPATILAPESYDLKDCIGLTPRKSLLNPQNYAYYIMGFTAKCTYPMRRAPSGRELLWDGMGIDTDTIGSLYFRLTSTTPPPPGQSGTLTPVPVHNYTSAMLSLPRPPNAFLNSTYASAYFQARDRQVTVGVFLRDLSGDSSNTSCFNQLTRGNYVDDINDFIGFVLNPIRIGNWSATGVVQNVTEPQGAAPLKCMEIKAEVSRGD